MTLAVPRPAPVGFEVPDLSQLRIALLMGGRSGEREISLWTGRSVGEALRRADQPAGQVVDVVIDLDGAWHVAGARLEPLSALARLAHVDVFFLCLHGGAGEDGTIQGLLASAGRRFTGSGVRASALCMDKEATRSLAGSDGVQIAPGLCFSGADWRTRAAELRARMNSLANSGWVVKPRCGGSSVATTMAREEHERDAGIDVVLATGDDALVEAVVPGVELSCGVLGNRGDEPLALPPIEIRPALGRFFDYEQKYSSGGAGEVCPPCSVGPASIERVRVLAARLHRRVGCDGYSRTDFIVPVPDGAEGEPVLLEINTLPGLTTRSLLPQEAAVQGVDYRSLCAILIGLALRRDAGERP